MKKHISVGAVCPICGAEAIEMASDPVDVRSGGATYQVTGFRYERCSACGETFFAAGQSDDLRREAARMARECEGLLAPDEIRALRLDLGLTQGALEELLGIGDRMVTKWERGLFPQSRTADTLMRIVRAHPELLREPELAFVAREGRGPYRTRRT